MVRSYVWSRIAKGRALKRRTNARATDKELYDRRGQELLEDVTVLCRNCHETFHRNGRLTKGDARTKEWRQA